jgi:hypothetical protein
MRLLSFLKRPPVIVSALAPAVFVSAIAYGCI